MADATSPFLNKRLRSLEQASADIARRGADQAKAERLRRLQDHGATFGRVILDGAFERVYEPDGTYRLQPVAGLPSDEHPLPGPSGSARTDTTPPSTHPGPTGTDGARHSGYCAALRDVSRWVAAVAMESRMDSGTLTALNVEIERLSRRGGEA